MVACLSNNDQVCLGQTHKMGISWFSTNPSANMASIIDMSTRNARYTMEKMTFYLKLRELGLTSLVSLSVTSNSILNLKENTFCYRKQRLIIFKLRKRIPKIGISRQKARRRCWSWKRNREEAGWPQERPTNKSRWPLAEEREKDRRKEDVPRETWG